MSGFKIPRSDHLFDSIDKEGSREFPERAGKGMEAGGEPHIPENGKHFNNRGSGDTWENQATATAISIDLDSNDDPKNKSDMDGMELVSVDRPLFLSVINLVQLMEPKIYLAVNPLMLLGTISPALPEIQEEAVDAVNDMIEFVWNRKTVLVVPIVLTPSAGLPAAKRGLEYPVLGLKVATKIVNTNPSNAAEEAIVRAKADFKNQDVMQCIESGRSIIKLTLLGRLVTAPPKPTLSHHYSTDEPSKVRDREGENTRSSRHRSRSRSRHSTRHRSHRRERNSSPSQSLYSNHERNERSGLGRLLKALRL